MTKGGFEVDFVKDYDELDNVMCSICLFVLREPMQSESCGHRFCKNCVEDLIKNDNGYYICPADRSEMKLFLDKGKEREILGRKVKCPNIKNGCNTTTELRHLENHHQQCPYEEINCVIKDCDEKIERRLLQDHTSNQCNYRVINCIFCDEIYSFHLEQEHIADCRKFLLCCDYCTKDDIPRSQMEVHLLQECPKLPHSCKFAAVGCERKILIGDIENHFNESKDTHLTLALEKIASQNEELKQHKIENRNQQLEITSLNTKLEAVMQRLEKTEKKLNITNFTDEFVLKIQNFAENFSTGKKLELHFTLPDDTDLRSGLIQKAQKRAFRIIFQCLSE